MENSSQIGAVASVNTSEVKRLEDIIAQLQLENQALRNENEELRSLKEVIVTPSHTPFEAITSEDEGSVFEDIDDEEDHTNRYVPNPNPLLIDLVLERLADNLDYSSLKEGRLVCKQWYKHLSPIFQRKSKMFAKLDLVERPMMAFESIFPSETADSRRFRALEIELPDHLKHFIGRDWIRQYGKSIEYLKLGYTWEDVCCETLDHEFLYPRSSCLRPFLLECCPNLKELIIPIPFFEEDAPDILVPMEQRSVHLKLLDIGIYYDFDYIDPEFGELLHEIFGLIAGVETLRLRSMEKCTGLGYLIRRIKKRPELVVLEHVCTLDLINYRMEALMLNTLAEINFSNLKKLTIGAFHGFQRNDVHSLCRLLKHLKSNLEELCLGGRMGEKFEEPLCTVITLPKLPKLKVFHNLSLYEWGIKTIDFVSQLPMLEELVLSKEKCDRILLGKIFGPEMQMRISPHRNLKVLKLNFNEYKVSEALQNIVEWFPNLEVLGFNLRMKKEEHPEKIIPLLASLTKLVKLIIHTEFEDVKYVLECKKVMSAFPNLKKVIVQEVSRLHTRLELSVKYVQQWSAIGLEFYGFQKPRILCNPKPPELDSDLNSSWSTTASESSDCGYLSSWTNTFHTC